MSPLQPVKRRHPHRAVLGGGVLLVFALLWAQLLGQVHQVRHVSHLHGGPVAQAAGHGSAPHADEAGPTADHAAGHLVDRAVGSGLLAHVLAPDGEAFDCRLYDTYSHADSLPALALLALPVLAAAAPCWTFAPHGRSASFALFEARGPPWVR